MNNENIKLEYKSIQEILNKMSNQIKISTVEKKPTLYSVWEKIVGHKIFLKCKLDDIKDKTMIIMVSHQGVAQQIKLQEKQILKNISKYYPELGIEKIKTKLETNYNVQKQKKLLPKKTINESQEKFDIQIKENLPKEIKELFKKMKITKKNN
ncbi:MAG: hypothetical protein CR988_05935 [Treponema sp.]|nr:MAG: hypothetical protein CR988_05935 [Treponema sp.]